MANLSDLSTITLAAGDLFPVLDIDDTSVFSTGSPKACPASAIETFLDLGTLADQDADDVDITGGSAVLDSLAVTDTTTPAYDLAIASNSSAALTSNKTLTLDVDNGNRTLKLSGNLTVQATTTITSFGATLVNNATADDARSDLGLGSAAVLAAGSANGVATLDSGGKVPVSQIPDAVLGQVEYQGTWDADANTPDLGASSPEKGYYYVVDTAGSTSLGGITDWKIGDWAIYNGTAWEKVDNTDQVTSVAGRIGAITLTTADITDGTATGISIFTASDVPAVWTILGLGTIADQDSDNVSITGGTIDGVAITGGTVLTAGSGGFGTLATNRLDLLETGPGGSALQVELNEGLSANRTLQLTVGDANRTLAIGGNTTLNGGTHSGTNTGDQTITLTGDVTGSGTGSFATAIGNDKVTVTMIADAELKAIAGLTSAADKGIHFTGSGTAAVHNLTAAGRKRVGFVQSTITADPTDPTVDTHYLCDASSASFTCTPTAATLGVGGRIRYTLTATASSRTVTIDPASGETILCRDGSSTTSVVLYVVGDTIEIESDGANWIMTHDGRIPHKGAMVRTTGQTLDNVTPTKILLNSADYDVGGITDASTDNRFEIRRAGKYTVTVSSLSGAVMNDGTAWQVAVFKNNSQVTTDVRNSSGASQNLNGEKTTTVDCAAGDYLDLRITHSRGSSLTTPTAVGERPTMVVMEVF